MNLIVLIGSGAVGKMTVGQELMKITDYRLFHNHHMIEPVIDRDGIAQIMLLGPARKPGNGIFKGIRELRPAECAMYCRCGLRKRTYWSLHALPHKETAEETEQHIAYLLTDAIKRRHSRQVTGVGR